MGFSIDEPKCLLVPLDEDRPPFLGHSTGTALCYMRAIRGKFVFKHDEDAMPRAPEVTETWRIGIVQNVLFEVLSLHYDGELPADSASGKAKQNNGKKQKPPLALCDQLLQNRDHKRTPLKMCNDNFAVDSMDGKQKNAYPFFSEPTNTPEQTTPYLRVYYNKKNGFGTRLKPGMKNDDNVEALHSATVVYRDQPSFKAPHLSAKGNPLSKAVHIITFGTWLVALDKNNTILQVIAHGDVFSLMYWATFQWNPNLRANGLQCTDSRSKMMKGEKHTIHDFKTEEPLSIHPGAGDKYPVIEGATVNVRDDKWIQANFPHAG